MDEIIGFVTGAVMFLALVFGALHLLGLMRGPTPRRRRASRTERATFLAGASSSDAGAWDGDVGGGDGPSEG